MPAGTLYNVTPQKRGVSWLTLSTCVWLGLYPSLHLGSYATLTRDKWILMFFLLFFTLLCALIDGIHCRLSAPTPLPILFASLLLCCILISCLHSEYDVSSWWLGTSSRREGLLTQLCYFLLFFFSASSQVNIIPVLISSSVGVILYFVEVILQRSGANPFSLYPIGTSFKTNPDFQGPTGNVDMAIGYLCLMIGLFLFFLLTGRRKKASPYVLLCSSQIFLLLFSSLCLCVFLLFTMDVQFGIISFFALTLFVALNNLPSRYRYVLLVSIIILVLLIIWFWPGENDTLWELHEMLHGQTKLSFGHNRIAVWVYTLRMSQERLFYGSGSDTFDLRFNTWLLQNNISIPHEQNGTLLPNYFDNPHNEYLAQLINHGLPAFFLFLALIISVLFHPRLRNSPYRFAVFAYSVQAFFSFSVCIIAPMFWVVLGLCCSSKNAFS